jgi:hypothetical protein
VVFFVLFFSTSSTSSSFLDNSVHIWAQTPLGLLQQPLPISGNVTAVNNNYTVGVNNNTLVSLAFINPNSTDETVVQDGIHYISVVCPIRSPVVVLPVSDSTSFDVKNPNSNLTRLVDGVVFCQTSNTSDINSTESINEQLLDARLANLDNNNNSSSNRICSTETLHTHS